MSRHVFNEGSGSETTGPWRNGTCCQMALIAPHIHLHVLSLFCQLFLFFISNSFELNITFFGMHCSPLIFCFKLTTKSKSSLPALLRFFIYLFKTNITLHVKSAIVRINSLFLVCLSKGEYVLYLS